MPEITPRRSVLYLPSSNDRAIAKAQLLDADVVILDLEDAVALNQKQKTREKLLSVVQTRSFGRSEVVVRVNTLDSEWGADDIAMFANAPIDALCLPKIECASDVHRAIQTLEHHNDSDTPLWVMAETPKGISNCEEIAQADTRVIALMLGTSDLLKDLRIPYSTGREGLLYSLSRAVLAARVAEIDVIDGVFVDLNDEEGFVASCKQGLALGFDGKSLIHPKQLDVANRTFSPTAADIDEAKEIIEAWQSCQAEGKGVTVVRGKLVESLHVEQAQRLLALQAAITTQNILD